MSIDKMGELMNKIAELEAKIREQQMTIEKMREAYAEAIEDIEEWANYADDYLKVKWRLKEDIKRHQDCLASIPPSEPTKEI